MKRCQLLVATMEEGLQLHQSLINKLKLAPKIDPSTGKIVTVVTKAFGSCEVYHGVQLRLAGGKRGRWYQFQSVVSIPESISPNARLPKHHGNISMYVVGNEITLFLWPSLLDVHIRADGGENVVLDKIVRP